MAEFFIGLFFVGLILLCGFITLLILMQKPSANAGMGAALGGGAAEQAFGGETGNILTRWTVYAIVLFFVICLGLYLAVLAESKVERTVTLPEITGSGVVDEMLPQTGEGEAEGVLESEATEAVEEGVIVDEGEPLSMEELLLGGSSAVESPDGNSSTSAESTSSSEGATTSGEDEERFLPGS
ncbi:MAG: preprotein translocase subunit SecG [Puniceicoccaceae bacterium]